MRRKFIFVTGGVASSLGKGIAVSSLGALLEARNLKVSLQKIDPYLNVDPGTMSPKEHGEVFVTDDGAETDLDLGNYERYTSMSAKKVNSITAGMIYEAIIMRERNGDFLGKTVQVIPHVTDEISGRINKAAEEADADVAIVEIGGTVGDIESIPFLEAARQFIRNKGKENVLFIHLTLVPTINAAGEMKTKPTQHSVKMLRELGIMPDMILCRSSRQIDEGMRKKIADSCDVNEEAVISATDVESSIYEIPIHYSEQGFDNYVVTKLHMLQALKLDLSRWRNIVETIQSITEEVNIALVGKYLAVHDAYKSVWEALDHGGFRNHVKINKIKIDPVNLENDKEDETLEILKNADGILIPGGFGDTGIEGKIKAVSYARIQDIPLFGICLGMQCMTVEFARNILGFADANSTEFRPETEHPVIDLMEGQKSLVGTGATMRLGAQNAKIISKSTKLYTAYKKREISERHRHRYEFNDKYKDEFEKAGLKISAVNSGLNLAEAVEITDKRWYVGVQFHPELKSKPFAPHPLFGDFIEAAFAYKQEKEKLGKKLKKHNKRGKQKLKEINKENEKKKTAAKKTKKTSTKKTAAVKSKTVKEESQEDNSSGQQ